MPRYDLEDRIFVCPSCRVEFNPVIDLRDDLSKTEFRISGLCQRCQDKVFQDMGGRA